MSNQWVRRFANREAPIAVLVILLVTMMVIPLPTPLLDILIAANITFAMLILLITLSTARPVDFSVFPTLLLLTTLFRLALNVSTSRLILLHGYAGRVIEAFGQFVVGGNPVVGFIIFLILVVIQYVVITRGAERVAEVAARFTLDAMPGKQMAIDADLSSGLIDETEARRRRQEIQREADFYGAMDGGSKFVKGDAVAGMVIIVINILAGFVIGMVEQGLSLTDALSRYTLLTVGDGLASQIPALLLSTATGIVVTRAASTGGMADDLQGQILGQTRLLWFTAGAILLLGLVPGLPFWAFALIATLLGILATANERKENQARREAETAQESREEERPPENVVSLLHIDPLELELGYGLLPLADSRQGGDLLDRVVMIRRQMVQDLGLVLSPIRVRDNLELAPEEYALRLRGVRVAGGELRIGHFLAMAPPGGATLEVPGMTTREPVFGLEALWITSEQRLQAETAGYTVVDPASVLATHLSEVVKEHAPELLGRQDVQNLVEALKKEQPAVVDELLPGLLTLGEVERVLRQLLAEQVSIRDLSTILEALADGARVTRDPDTLVELARTRLGRAIAHRYGFDRQRVPVVALSPEVEERLLGSVVRDEQGSRLILPAEEQTRLLQAISAEIGTLLRMGREPILLCAPAVRLLLRRLTEISLPRLVVLSHGEIGPRAQVEMVGNVSWSG